MQQIVIRMESIINGHEWIDLGLSVKWATCNVGASSPDDPGDYFAWGETVPKSEFTWENYKFWISGGWKDASFNKYTTEVGKKRDELVQMGDGIWWNMTSEKNRARCEQSVVDYKTCLEMSDDAAHVNWGGTWRMPTEKELSELVKKCIWTYSRLGYRVTSEKTGNSIFLPLTGSRSGSKNDSLPGIWSSTLKTDMSRFAYSIQFGYCHLWETDDVGLYARFRCYGLPVRPVSD